MHTIGRQQGPLQGLACCIPQLDASPHSARNPGHHGMIPAREEEGGPLKLYTRRKSVSVPARPAESGCQLLPEPAGNVAVEVAALLGFAVQLRTAFSGRPGQRRLDRESMAACHDSDCKGLLLLHFSSCLPKVLQFAPVVEEVTLQNFSCI